MNACLCVCLTSFVCLVSRSSLSGGCIVPCGVILWWYDGSVLEIGYCGVVLWYPVLEEVYVTRF